MSMQISGVTDLADATATAVSTAGSTTMGQETFLKLLVAQLQNQDPTAPMSNEEFVAQLAQFSSLEQLQTLNASMESIYYVNTSMNNAAMTSLLGQTVVAQSDTFHYDGSDGETLYYDASTQAATATITISDADGSVVFSGSLGTLEAGEGSYTWNGKDVNGQPVSDGDYTFRIEGQDSDGSTVEIQTLIRGVVDEMAFDSGAASPSINGVTLAMSDIIRLYTEAP